ncbi:MAG TPA: SAM-dependent chlorinase/fluorinase [Methylomirabilota bacterium]
MPAVITLTTDFGLRDPYVAELKGTILGINPDVQLVDVSHDVDPHDITEAALTVEAAAPRFPPGTIHVAVVDPGVGTARRGLVVTAGGHVFVGPDNGLFTACFGRAGWRAVELTAPEYRAAVVSRTFHGRDVFAPAAAHLSLGVDPARFGPGVDDPVRLTWPDVRALPDAVAGTVLHVDRFGNLITSIHRDTVESLGAGVTVRVARRLLPLVGTYGDLPPGAPGALVGSRDRLEIAVREGSAAGLLGAGRGTSVMVSRKEPSRVPATRSRRNR